MIRLTIARYYTPSGRLIQSPYKDGYDKYMQNFYKRYTDGEMMTADSTHFPDSIKFKTLVNKRVVYGGGGIMPDVFVAADTSYNTVYLSRLNGKNVFSSFSLEYFDKNRVTLSSQYKSFEEFKNKFHFSPDEIKSFIAKGEAEGVKYNDDQFNRSKNEIMLVLKGFIASNMWQTGDFYHIVNENDKVIEKALKIVSDKKSYNTILGYQ
jgi:carboxyl-terminal processing protease